VSCSLLRPYIAAPAHRFKRCKVCDCSPPSFTYCKLLHVAKVTPPEILDAAQAWSSARSCPTGSSRQPRSCNASISLRSPCLTYFMHMGLLVPCWYCLSLDCAPYPIVQAYAKSLVNLWRRLPQRRFRVTCAVLKISRFRHCPRAQPSSPPPAPLTVTSANRHAVVIARSALAARPHSVRRRCRRRHRARSYKIRVAPASAMHTTLPAPLV
jgi:hypothetical protein